MRSPMRPGIRAGVAALLLLVLVIDGAGWSWAFSSGALKSGRMLLYPEQMDGESVVLSLVTVTEARPEEGRFTVRTGKQHIPVEGPVEGFAVGDEIYVGGTFRWDAGPSVIAEWTERAPERGNKKLLGILGLLATAAILPFTLGWRRDGVVLRG